MGVYPVGMKLPSCRELAGELCSNSSTVDRAIGRLAASGYVRTIPRRGTFVEQTSVAVIDPRQVIAEHLDLLLMRARRLGLTELELAGLVSEALARVESMRRIAVVECNERDLALIRELVQVAAGIEVQPVMLSDASGRYLDDEYDLVAVPIFHLNDVADLIRDMDNVIDLNLVASPTALRELVEVRNVPRIVVVAPTERGVQWMTAIVGQYYPGPIDSVQTGKDDPAMLDGAEVIVVNNAAALQQGIELRVGRIIRIVWELDPRFSVELRSQVERRLAERSAP